MAKAETGTVSSTEELDVIVDTDAHILESIDDFFPYFDSRFEASKQIVSNANRPRENIYSVTHGLPSRAMFQREHLADKPRRKEEGYTPNEKLKEMGDFGIDYGVLDPTLNLSLTTCENRQIAAGLANAYNSWVLDQYADEVDEFKVNLLVAPQKPELAAEEIDERADEDDTVGIMIPNTGALPPLGHEMYDPIYQAAEDNDLPVCMHGGNGATFRGFPTQRQWNESYTENHVIVHPFGHMWGLTTMMVRGVPERFPDLDLVFQESGIGWIPYTIWRLDDHYLLRPYEFHIDRLPSEYIAEQCYFTTQPLGHTVNNPKHLAYAIEMAGPENIMFSSDLPHSDFDTPDELFSRIHDHFDEETVRGIMGETAIDVFDIDR
jgi:predicted TIM-barrel fold metal-dependent hydrolase